MMRSLVIALVALVPSAVLAAGKPLPASQHDPKLFVDPGATWINVNGYDNDYSVGAAFRINGATSSKDRARLEWKAQGKTVATLNCPSTSYDEKSHNLNVDCSLDAHVNVTGPVDAELIYVDDSNDTEYVVTTFHVTVRSWKGIGKYMNWGILPDDLLAVAYVRHWYGDTAFHKPLIEFWSTASLVGDATLRCTIDGKKVPDFEAHIDAAQAAGQREVQTSVTTPKEHRTYLYEHYNVEPDFHFGSKEDHGIYDPTRMKWIIDSPGKWVCVLRKDGHQIREFAFTVNDKGMVEQSELQSGQHPIPTLPNVVLIDMKIPADNGVEKRIRPDAMRKSIGYGIAWPDGAKAKELQAAFPPASGLPD